MTHIDPALVQMLGWGILLFVGAIGYSLGWYFRGRQQRRPSPPRRIDDSRRRRRHAAQKARVRFK